MFDHGHFSLEPASSYAYNHKQDVRISKGGLNEFVNAIGDTDVDEDEDEFEEKPSVFGDVIGFDATYSKNKFLCPFVIFSGVNNHNQTVIFATALVSDETEQKYVLLLEQFVDAMKGKAPVSVTTDGDLAMKNAIKSAFPYVHHRLCVWHLICNANSNVHILGFMKSFKKCMLGDFEVGKFENLWDEMVNEFGLHESRWIADMHNKRHMWATSYIKGSFFAGISTTSREGFHSHLGKFVSSKIGLFEFVEQFQRCLTYFRYRKFKADFDSDYGNVVPQTSL
ncbi:hypothetical protein JHK86_050088 [Glycine max]|nr:hypothetical protein JHK86_050088 [Glycine max]